MILAGNLFVYMENTGIEKKLIVIMINIIVGFNIAIRIRIHIDNIAHPL
jgi:hypothetical protein